MRRHHLTADERTQGVRVQDLARHWGVSREAIHATLKVVTGSGQQGAQAAPAALGTKRAFQDEPQRP